MLSRLSLSGVLIMCEHVPGAAADTAQQKRDTKPQKSQTIAFGTGPRNSPKHSMHGEDSMTLTFGWLPLAHRIMQTLSKGPLIFFGHLQGNKALTSSDH